MKRDLLPLSAYKDYFKKYIKSNNSPNIRKNDDLNKMYLKCRKKYQSYVTNKKNCHGLKLQGSKIYEKLPLNIFNDNYILNTSNISKELQNKALEYFFPYYNKNNLTNKNKSGEKIKLTPIPFKNKILIDNEIEKNNILTAKRSAVLMRRVEYTHLITQNTLKNIENPEYSREIMNLTNKLCLLKGAVLIIEDWWKEMKINKSKKKKKEIVNKDKDEDKEINNNKVQRINYELFGNNNLEYSINFTKPNVINYKNKKNNNFNYIKANKIQSNKETSNNSIKKNKKIKYTNLYISGNKLCKSNSVKGIHKLKLIKDDSTKNKNNNLFTEYEIIERVNNKKKTNDNLQNTNNKRRYSNKNINNSTSVNSNNLKISKKIKDNENIEKNNNEIIIDGNENKEKEKEKEKNKYIRYLTPLDLSQKTLIKNKFPKNNLNKAKYPKNFSYNEETSQNSPKRINQRNKRKINLSCGTTNQNSYKKFIKHDNKNLKKRKNNNDNYTYVNNSINTDLIKKIIKESVKDLKNEIRTSTNKKRKNNNLNNTKINTNNNSLLFSENINSNKKANKKINTILPLVYNKQNKKNNYNNNILTNKSIEFVFNYNDIEKINKSISKSKYNKNNKHNKNSKNKYSRNSSSKEKYNKKIK